MTNALLTQLRKYHMLQPGDTVYCAVSGGADSMALLWAMYLLKDKLSITLRAAHFDHGLRGEESPRDAAFVRDVCNGYGIPLEMGQGTVVPGKKGLEAAARDARYTFLKALPGKIATAHTADDNAETLLMHLVRGTGLKGLGGIAPVNGKLIRPMLGITRQEVEAFLAEYSIPFVQDSSNDTDDFLRNRIRHHVMPLLKQENPRLAENLSATAQRLRLDEAALCRLSPVSADIETIKNAAPAIRSRILDRFLKDSGVPEPNAEHIALAEALVFSSNPSASAQFPGGITLGRCYDSLAVIPDAAKPMRMLLPFGTTELPELGLKVTCAPAQSPENTPYCFTVQPKGQILLRSRQTGDAIRLPGGTRTLKKLMIDRKIPANQRQKVPVVCDDGGILGVYGIGADQDRRADTLPAITLRFEFL